MTKISVRRHLGTLMSHASESAIRACMGGGYVCREGIAIFMKNFQIIKKVFELLTHLIEWNAQTVSTSQFCKKRKLSDALQGRRVSIV